MRYFSQICKEQITYKIFSAKTYKCPSLIRHFHTNNKYLWMKFDNFIKLNILLKSSFRYSKIIVCQKNRTLLEKGRKAFSWKLLFLNSKTKS